MSVPGAADRTALSASSALPRPGRRAPDGLAAQLPLGLVEDDLLRRFVLLLQTLSDSVLEHVDNLGLLLDPAVAPPAMLRYLGSWLGEDLSFEEVSEPVLRRWVAQAATLIRWRGTARGIADMATLLTGLPVEVTDDGGVYREGEARPYRSGHVVVMARGLGPLTAADFVSVVLAELPAYATATILVGDRQLWPAQNEEAPDGAIDLS